MFHLWIEVDSGRGRGDDLRKPYIGEISLNDAKSQHHDIKLEEMSLYPIESSSHLRVSSPYSLHLKL